MFRTIRNMLLPKSVFHSLTFLSPSLPLQLYTIITMTVECRMHTLIVCCHFESFLILLAQLSFSNWLKFVSHQPFCVAFHHFLIFASFLLHTFCQAIWSFLFGYRYPFLSRFDIRLFACKLMWFYLRYYKCRWKTLQTRHWYCSMQF